VPKPWLFEIPPEILPGARDAQIADKLRRSNPFAFGSTRLQGFSAGSMGQQLTDALLPTAAGILFFYATKATMM
jgi:hypothetical protein